MGSGGVWAESLADDKNRSSASLRFRASVSGSDAVSLGELRSGSRVRGDRAFTGLAGFVVRIAAGFGGFGLDDCVDSQPGILHGVAWNRRNESISCPRIRIRRI